MIKVVSGFGGPGGSTVALNNLVNLFNSKGMAATFYTPTKWEGISCKWDNVSNCKFKPSDICIYHFSLITERPKVKKVILSCHETNVFRIKDKKDIQYDAAHFVSQYQKDWQGVEGVVIPNVVTRYKPKLNKDRRIAGIIGSIDRNKRTHLSILKALEDKHDDIRLYGAVTDQVYFTSEISPLLGDKVSYRGVATNMNSVYDLLTDVYHSSERETFNLVKAECLSAGVCYHGFEVNKPNAEYWDDERIFKAWKDLLST